VVKIDAAASKVGDRRRTDLPNNLVDWLRLARGNAVDANPVAPSYATLRRRMRAMRAAVSAIWIQDILRHTAVSHWITLHGDAGKVATQLGTSVAILNSCYASMVATVDTLAFFALTSKSVPPADPGPPKSKGGRPKGRPNGPLDIR
jgi:hypothetical protein